MEQPKTICERELEIKGTDDTPERTLLLKIKEPREDLREGGDWECSFELTGLDETMHKTFFGVDSLQALIHCLMGAAAILRYLEREKRASITWMGSKDWGLEIKY